MKRSFLCCPSINKRGLTLVEVLLSVTIFAVIAVSVAGTFFSGFKLWDRIRNVDFIKTSSRLDLEKVSRDMRQAMDVPVIGFEGEIGRFSFPAMQNDAIIRLTYYFDVQQGALMRKTEGLSSIRDGRSDETWPITRALEATEFSFQYLAVTADGPQWVNVWKKDNGIVHHVRLQGVSKGVPFSKTVLIAVGK